MGNFQDALCCFERQDNQETDFCGLIQCYLNINQVNKDTQFIYGWINYWSVVRCNRPYLTQSRTSPVSQSHLQYWGASPYLLEYLLKVKCQLFSVGPNVSCFCFFQPSGASVLAAGLVSKDPQLAQDLAAYQVSILLFVRFHNFVFFWQSIFKEINMEALSWCNFKVSGWDGLLFTRIAFAVIFQFQAEAAWQLGEWSDLNEFTKQEIFALILWTKLLLNLNKTYWCQLCYSFKFKKGCATDLGMKSVIEI